MKLLAIILSFGILANLHGQTSPALDNLLTKEFPEKSLKDGRWVYYPDKANIEVIEKPLLRETLPNYSIYRITLINYLGYHVNEGTCIVLVDSVKSKIILVPPLWYGDISASLIKLYMKKEFRSSEHLLNFLTELNEVMEIGSVYKFVNTSSTDHLITFDLVYSKGKAYTTGGNGTSSTINYARDGIWRQIEIKVKDLKMIEYTYINPALKDNTEFQRDYRTIIK